MKKRVTAIICESKRDLSFAVAYSDGVYNLKVKSSSPVLINKIQLISDCDFPLTKRFSAMVILREWGYDTVSVERDLR